MLLRIHRYYIGIENDCRDILTNYLSKPGFDAIAATGEELVNPKKNIPLSIFVTLLVTGGLYCGIAVVLTLMVPYYKIDIQTPLPFAFIYVDLAWFRYVATVGAIITITTW